MRERKSPNYAGQLLVAHPSLRDPNFRRSVLFISSHDIEEGAIGVILNRPLDKQVSELVPESAPEILADVPVYLGGPVATNELMFAAFDWQNGESLILNQNIALQHIEPNEEIPRGIRAFVGYAGWSAGQLETELRQHAWLLHKPKPAALATERLPQLWFEIMRELGPWFHMLAAAPDDPSLN
ncbi:MAG TPA: YqgE/AlgH family protein [Chthoniobacterales bacterium]|nr:YqgE/AlgH family protein [Chthoniobacterales bacterium]